MTLALSPKQMRILLATFLVVGIGSAWILFSREDCSDQSRFLLTIGWPFVALLIPMSAWASAMILWLLGSRAPALAAQPHGVRMNCVFHPKTIPWNQHEKVRLTETPSYRKSVEVIEFARKGRRPVRYPLLLIAEEPDDIRRWVDAVSARLASHAATA